jgi:hypothetical protein
MRPTVEGAARLLMHLAVSPDELPISSQEIPTPSPALNSNPSPNPAPSPSRSP